MQIETNIAKRKLAYVWIFNASIIFFLLLILSASGKYKHSETQLWGWFLQNITPILTLIIGTIVFDSKRSQVKRIVVEKHYWVVCIVLSLVYLILLVTTLLVVPFAQKHGGFKAIEFVNFSNIYLGPFQGFVTAALGIFFIKSKEDS